MIRTQPAGGIGGGGAGGSDPFAQCMERPPGDTACACSPLVSNCSGNTKCSTNFIIDLNDGTVLRFPALDGSEESPATDCIFADLETFGVGGSYNNFSVGDQRRDDCDENLHCEQFAQDDLRCVALCTLLFTPCTSGVCTPFGLTNAGYDEFGRCL